MTERFGDRWSILLKALWVCQELLILLEPRYIWQGEIDKISDCVKFWCFMGRINHILQESDKGQIFYWSIQTCSRIRRLIGWWIVTMLKKPQNCSISDFFDLTPKYFLPLLPYTDLVPPSTDPVPPSTNQYRPILTQYHHVSTITALCCSSTTKYQQVSPHTDPVTSCINHYRPLLIQYHQVRPSIAPYWPSTIIYQPVPLHTVPVPPSINKYRPILTHYHHVSTSTTFYWPSTTKYQPVVPSTNLVPSYINQNHSILTQYHKGSTVPPSTNWYRLLLTKLNS